MHYIPLHINTCYTFLNSCLKIKDLVTVCKKNEYNSIGICDISGAYAFPSFDDACLKNNIKPIFGVTLNIKLDEEFPICVYIKNEEGYSNVCYLLAHSKNITLDLLNSHKNGLILIIPCQTNKTVYSAFLNNDSDSIHKVIFDIQKGFDDSYLGIELYSKEDKDVMKKVRSYASNYSYKTIAFPKQLYISKKDAGTLTILNAIRDNKNLELNFEQTGPYYFLGEIALNTLYTKQELQETENLASQISFTLKKKRGSLLQFSTGNQIDKKKFILFKCKETMTKRGLSITKPYQDRLNEELDMIEKMGYLDYFLIVSDYVNEAKKRNIPVGPGRGSAAGALVSYCLGITEVDPLKYDLFFERFLNPERITLPDIDVDFADYRRNEVTEYIKSKYGANRMSYIVTFQEIGAKQAIQDIGSVFNVNKQDVMTMSRACKAKGKSILENRKEIPEFDNLCKDSYFGKYLALANLIEGYPRQPGMHAAGIILNNDPLENIIPTSLNEENNFVCHYEKDYLEEQGFLKMDILAVSNLSMIESIVNRVKARGVQFDLSLLPLNDEKTFLTLNAGLTQGIFQLSEEGITRALKEIKINSFDDLIALLALYRPGPMQFIKTYAYNKNNNVEVKYVDDSIKDILSPTYGVIVYQEQIMQIVQKVASFSLGQADILRRAISKKDESKLNSLKESFINGALKNNYSLETATKIYEMIDRFSNYGFNKSHTVAYAIITYQMAYLKAHFPCEFFATILDYNSISKALSKLKNEFKLLDVQLALPDINHSNETYAVRFNQLVMPLSSIKGLPFDMQKAIVHERKTDGPFKDFESFVLRMYEYKITKDQLEALINAGCFDYTKQTRATLRNEVKTILDYIRVAISQISLLSDDEASSVLPRVKKLEEDYSIKYQKELDTLGILLSGSLFNRYQSNIKKSNAKTIAESLTIRDPLVVAILQDYKEITTKKKESMAYLTLLDDEQAMTGVLFPDTFKKYKVKLYRNKPYLFKGYYRLDNNGEQNLIINELIDLEEDK